VPAIVNENVIRTNLLGYINGAQEVIPYFKIQGYGIIINNISVGGWLPTPFATAYSASKFGIRGFSEALKGELASYRDIHVVDLYPGFLDTPGMQHAANYTGKVLRPAPPVYDARKLARAVVSVIKTPISRKTVGASSGFLRLSYALFPKLTRNITGMVIRKYLQQAEAIDHTSGNVIHPVEFGTSVDGGWRLKQVPGVATTALLIFGAVAIGGFIAASRK
jgi:short-subunit dehydrogenase